MRSRVTVHSQLHLGNLVVKIEYAVLDPMRGSLAIYLKNAQSFHSLSIVHVQTAPLKTCLQAWFTQVAASLEIFCHRVAEF